MKVLILKDDIGSDSCAYEIVTDVILVDDSFNAKDLEKLYSQYFKHCKECLEKLKLDPNNYTKKKVLKESTHRQNVKDCGTFVDFLERKGFNRVEFIE